MPPCENRPVKVTVIGCSPAWPNPGGAHSGYLVEGSGRLLLDCGPGVLARLRASEGWPLVDAIVLTHLHLDHFGDIVPWIFGAAFGAGRDRPAPPLWVPAPCLPDLHALGEQLSFGPVLGRAFDLRSYDDGVEFDAAGFAVTPFRVPHYDQVAFALRVSGPGGVVAYSGDSAPSATLSLVAADADLFLCEATLADSGAEGELRGHLSAEEAIDAAAAARARRLVLVHRPDELPTPAGVERAGDGDVLTV